MTKVMISMRSFKEFVKDQLSAGNLASSEERFGVCGNGAIKRVAEQIELNTKRMCTRAHASKSAALSNPNKCQEPIPNDEVPSLIEVVNIENFQFECYSTKEALMRRFENVSGYTNKQPLQSKRNARNSRTPIKTTRQKALLWAPVVASSERQTEGIEKNVSKTQEDEIMDDINESSSFACTGKSLREIDQGFQDVSMEDNNNTNEIKAEDGRESSCSSDVVVHSNSDESNHANLDIEKPNLSSNMSYAELKRCVAEEMIQTVYEKTTSTADYSDDENVDVVVVDDKAENCVTPLLSAKERPVSPQTIMRFFDSSLCARVRPFLPRNMRNLNSSVNILNKEEDADCICLFDSSTKDTRIVGPQADNAFVPTTAPMNQVRENLVKAIEIRQTQLINLKIRSRSVVGDGKTVMLRVTTHIEWSKMKRKVMRFISQVLKSECCNWIDIDLFFDRDILVRLIFNKINKSASANRPPQRIIDVQIMKLEPYKSTCEKNSNVGECRYGTLCGFKFHAHQLCEKVDNCNYTLLNSPNLLRRTNSENKRIESDSHTETNAKYDPFISDIVTFILNNLVNYIDEHIPVSCIYAATNSSLSNVNCAQDNLKNISTTVKTYSSSQIKAIPIRSTSSHNSLIFDKAQEQLYGDGSLMCDVISTPKQVSRQFPKQTRTLQCFKIRNQSKPSVKLVRLVSGNESCSTPVYTSINTSDKSNSVVRTSVAATVTLVRPIVRYMSNRKVYVGSRSSSQRPPQHPNSERLSRSDALMSHRAILRFYFKALLDVKGPLVYKRTLVQLYVFCKLIQSHSPDCQPHPDDIPNDGVRNFLSLCLDILSDTLTHKDYSLIDSYCGTALSRRYRQLPLQQLEELANFLDDELVRFTFSSDCWTLAGLRTRLNSLLDFFERTLYNSDPLFVDIYARLLLMLKCLRWNDQIVPREILQALFQLLISADKPNNVSFSILAAALRRLIAFLRDILNAPRNFNISHSSFNDDSVVVLSD